MTKNPSAIIAANSTEGLAKENNTRKIKFGIQYNRDLGETNYADKIT